MFEDYYWSCMVESIAFTDADQENPEYLVVETGGPRYSVFDTGSTHLHFPKSLFDPFITELKANSRNPTITANSDGTQTISCDDKDKFAKVNLLI